MRQRLDQILAERGLVASRARARDLIKRGLVRVDGVPAHKASQTVTGSERFDIAADVVNDVSRGAEKLRGGLSAFGFETSGRACLDIGASTGGFTQVLLTAGATHVYAVDVGQGQLHDTLIGDARVTNLEGVDARALTRDDIPRRITAVVCDVSFISLTKALPAALALAECGAWCIALIKPQFEAGPEALGKGGIVKDPAVHSDVVASIEHWFGTQPSWSVCATVQSSIAGGDGNAEWLIGARKGVARDD